MLDIVFTANSTNAKFSQHAIFHIPEAAFRNNIAAGGFIDIFH